METQQPSIGRIVIYAHETEGNIAAIITSVNWQEVNVNEETITTAVNLILFMKDGLLQFRENVKQDEIDNPPSIGKWRWPVRV